ncbi:MAG: hypothetical protein M5R41_13555 [Bacteroidia bacterium]|nr:hypothetical protein [Bacteroidia bacterium]
MHARTGRRWAEWFELLDTEGAAQLSHNKIVALLKNGTSLSAWWQQMVTVSYEQARGLRDKHEKADGYSISVTKTLTADLSYVYAHWKNGRQRMYWLTEKFKITTARENASLRILWNDGSRVIVDFAVTANGRCRVSVQHEKLPDRVSAERMKVYWRGRLAALAGRLGQ